MNSSQTSRFLGLASKYQVHEITPITEYMKSVCAFFLLFSLLNAETHNKDALSCYSCIIIYQFAKVGSTSLLYMLKPYCPVIHTHEPEPVIQAMSENRQFLVINAMRNLFDRNISGYFHFLSGGLIKELQGDKLSDLLAAFPKFNNQMINGAEAWYKNFNQLLGLHIFDHPFDFEKKYYFEGKDGYDVLILRYEDIEEWTAIIEHVLNLKGLVLPRLNVRKDPNYDNFKKLVRFSEEDAQRMLSIDYMRHFYTEEERERFSRQT